MELYKLTIKDALTGLGEKKFSSYELTKAVLARIQALDKKIKAYLTINNEALPQAQQADELITKKGSLPLLGVPFCLKDNICTQGLRTTAASKVLENYVPVYDATVAQRLKKAGAVILGKTNMDAWAHGSSTETSDFFTTKNPWDMTKLPGGSSGGSAAAIISDMTIGAIGTETAGSIRQPAAWCGITGLKPTYGRVSRYGIISMGSSLDSPGPMTKTVEDAALVLNVIAGFDPHDATSSNESITNLAGDFKKDIKRIKIGISSSYFEVADKKVAQRVLEAIKIFEKLGATVKRVRLIDPKLSISVYTILQRAEVSTNLARYDGIRYGNDRSYFGQEAKKRIMLGAYTLSAGYYDALYAQAQKIRTMIVQDFKAAFKEVDVIIAPTSPSTALPLGASKTDPMFGEVQDVLVEPSTIAGLAALNIPCGFIDSLPVGMQIIGSQFNESLLLRIGYAYQQVTGWYKRRPKL